MKNALLWMLKVQSLNTGGQVRLHKIKAYTRGVIVEESSDKRRIILPFPVLLDCDPLG